MPSATTDELTAQAIEIGTDQRIYIVGRTRSGKSYLARHLFRSIKRFVVCDPKNALGKWKLQDWNHETEKLLREGEPMRVRIVGEPFADPLDFWDDMLRRLFAIGEQTGQLFVYVDEVFLLSGGEGAKFPQGLRAIWTNGGGIGIGACAVSQFPRFIPKYLISEAEHFFVFRLTLPEHRKYVADWTDERLASPIPKDDEHGFYYYSIFGDDPVYFPKLEKGHGEGWGEIAEPVAEPAIDRDEIRRLREREKAES